MAFVSKHLSDDWNLDWVEILKPLEELKDCSICPRDCHADRSSPWLGYCQAGVGYAIDAIFPHQGEEPVISGKHGICNLFFNHCNMQCIYCQNYQISDDKEPITNATEDIVGIVRQIEAVMNSGVNLVGFVSPSHFIPQMKTIMSALKARKRDPVFVFNTNGYDRRETIEGLEGLMHVYLPDLKYMDNRLARQYSDTPDYVEFASAAVREMFRQKGSNLWLDDNGVIQSGLIIRHLILPGEIENSKAVLRFIAEELSPSVHVSLMSQYYPTHRVLQTPELDRQLTPEEYEEVVEEFTKLGFHRGWVQDLDSPRNYRPDFLKKRPFEDK